MAEWAPYWGAMFVAMLNYLEPEERWDVLDIAGIVFAGEQADYCLGLAEKLALMIGKDLRSAQDDPDHPIVDLSRPALWEAFRSAVDAHTVAPSYGWEYKYEVVETVIEAQGCKKMPSCEILSVEDVELDIAKEIRKLRAEGFFQYEEEALVNSLNDEWERKLRRRYWRNKVKRDLRKVKKKSSDKKQLVMEEFEIPAWVFEEKPVPVYEGVDWMRKKLNRVKRKLVRYTAWLRYLEKKAFDDAEARFTDRSATIADFWFIEPQAGGAKQKREERDAKQRAAAKERVKQERKKVPKQERERKVKAERDKRNPVFQSGKFLPAAIGAGATILIGKVWKLLNKADKAMDGVNKLFEQLKKLGNNLKEFLGKAIWHIPIVLTVFFGIKHFTGLSGLTVGIMVAALAKLVGPKIWATISEFFPDGDVQSQAGAGSVFDIAPKLLSVLFSFSVLKNKRPGSTTEFCKRLSMIDRMAGGWETFLKWMLKALETLVNYVRRLFGKERVQFFKDAHGPTYEWAKKIDGICLVEATGGDVSADRLDEMVDLVRQGFAYKEVYRGTSMAKFVDDYVIKIVNALLPYQGALNARNNFRFEPATLMIYGKPGIGKTLMAMHMCTAVMLEAGLVPSNVGFNDVVKQVWQKGNSEYWNGYAGQTCLVMDDAFQQRADLSDKENDFMSLIRMVSSWSFPLNFADLASKGKIYFNSKFIFGTTNLASIDSEARIVIQEPDAVARRLTFPYHLRVKDEFVINAHGGERLDYAKFAKECELCASAEKPLDRFPWHIWEAAQHDFLTGRTSNMWIPLREVVERVSEDLRTRLAAHDNSKQLLRSFINGYGHVPKPEEAEQQAGKRLEKELKPEEHDLTGLSADSKEVASRILNGGSYYAILGIGVDATQACIKRAYSNMALRIHPDKCGPHIAAAEAMKRLNRIMDEVSEARRIREEFSRKLKKNIWETIEFGKIVSFAIGFAVSAFLTTLAIRALKALLSFGWGLLCDLFGRGRKTKGNKKQAAQQSNRPLTPRTRKAGIRDPVFQTVDTVVSSNIYANTYKLYASMSEGEVVIGQVMFLMLNLAVQPEHFTQQLREMIRDGQLTYDSKLFFRNAANHEHVLSFSVKHYLELKRSVVPQCDVEFVNFGTVRGHRNVVANFMREADLKHMSGRSCRLDICEVDVNKRIVNVNKRQTYVLSTIRYGEGIRAGGKYIKRYFTYSAPTDLGDCGAPLCVLNNSTFCGRTCMGFHVAGNRLHELGYSAIITQEMIQEAVKDLDIIVDNFEADLKERAGIELQACNELPFQKKGSFLAIGTVPKPVTICPKTSYYPTNLFGKMGEYDCWPAHLSPVWIDGEIIYPMENAVSNYSSPLLIYEQPWLKQCLHTAMKPLTALIKDMPKRLYSFDEAVLGVPQEKFRSIPRGTAAGFPYVYDVRNGKKEFFGENQDYDLTTERAKELRERVDYIIDQASKNVRLSHVFVDFLKDELRPAAKVKAVATRLISSAPLDYTIAWRMYFGAFSSAVMRMHTRSGMAPGICVYTDWDILVDRLSTKGKKCFDGDFKAFDSSEQPCIHDLILDYINRWYDDGPENARIRRVLWLDLVHSRHIGGTGCDQRHIYQWNKSLPSGHPFTTIVNSMYSLFLLVGAYISITGEMTSFWEFVSTVVYGDDNASNVADEKAEVYNQTTVARALEQEFEVKYTPGNKTGDYETTMDLTDLTFLKRGFVERDNRWLCPLDLDSFLYTCYWCKNKKLEKEIMIDVLENALEELSMHDERTWNTYAPQISDILGLRNHVTRALVEQDQYLRLVTSRADNWY